jgi:hypothetical protein
MALESADFLGSGRAERVCPFDIIFSPFLAAAFAVRNLAPSTMLPGPFNAPYWLLIESVSIIEIYKTEKLGILQV